MSDTEPRLLDNARLERSEVVANAAMNRGRGLSGVNSYERDLEFGVFSFLRECWLRQEPRSVAWLDLCCGQGRALIGAARALKDADEAEGVRLIGVDLVPMFDTPDPDLTPPLLTLTAASVSEWEPPSALPGFDLITCVHGLHYVGDKLGLLARAASWLAPKGVLLAHLDPVNVRIGEGSDSRRVVPAALRAAGFDFDRRARLVGREGRGAPVVWPLRYLGADDTAGPNATGQPAVCSHYLQMVD